MLNELALRVLVTLQGFGQSVEAKFKDEEGQTLAEYGLIMAVIAVVVVTTAVIFFRDAIVTAFNSATDCLDGSC